MFEIMYNPTIGLISLIFGVVVFLVYLIAVRCDFGPLKSISISYYYVKPHWLFQVFIWASAFSILLSGQAIFFTLSGLCLVIMAAFPTIKEKEYYLPHMIFAISGLSLSILGLGITFGLWYLIGALLLSVIIAYPIVKKRGTFIYWLEVLSISTIIIGIFIGRFL